MHKTCVEHLRTCMQNQGILPGRMPLHAWRPSNHTHSSPGNMALPQARLRACPLPLVVGRSTGAQTMHASIGRAWENEGQGAHRHRALLLLHAKGTPAAQKHIHFMCTNRACCKRLFDALGTEYVGRSFGTPQCQVVVSLMPGRIGTYMPTRLAALRRGA